VKIDLHLHTNYSDGRLDPGDLLSLCRKHNYNVISITDHDNIEAYLSVKDIAPKYGLTLIPGVELSSNYEDSEVHILAYYYDDEHPNLLSLFDYINENRIDRAKKIVLKLADLGLDIDIDSLLAETERSGIIGRMHIARALVAQKYCSSIKEAFDKYLHDKSPAYEQKVTLPAEKTIEMIHSAGGISVLAHPHKLDNISIIMGLIDMGIKGLEVHCPKSSNYAINLFTQIANENNLLITGGSDFHGEQEEIQDFGKFSIPVMIWEEFSNYYQESLNEEVRSV